MEHLAIKETPVNTISTKTGANIRFELGAHVALCLLDMQVGIYLLTHYVLELNKPTRSVLYCC